MTILLLRSPVRELRPHAVEPDLIGYDQTSSFESTSYWVQQMFARNVGDKVLPVTASATGLYYSATIDSRSARST
jgi:hypothetical protein